MSIQTSRFDNLFGLSGEKILPYSIKGEIFDYLNTIYILYTDTSGSIFIQQVENNTNTKIYTSDDKIVIQNLQIDKSNGRVWIGGYLDKPMRGFIASFDIIVDASKNISFTKVQIKPLDNIKNVEVIYILDKLNILFTGISNQNNCWILHNNYNKIYNIDLPSNSFNVKDIKLVNRNFYIFIELLDLSKNKIIQTYVIPNNTLIGSFI